MREEKKTLLALEKIKTKIPIMHQLSKPQFPVLKPHLDLLVKMKPLLWESQEMVARSEVLVGA